MHFFDLYDKQNKHMEGSQQYQGISACTGSPPLSREDY